MIVLADTHAHLSDESFNADRSDVLARAREKGVSAVVAVSENADDFRRTLEISRCFPDIVRPAAGLFPTVLDLDQASKMQDLIRAHRDEIIGIGEVGLDLWKIQDAEEREIQREIFCQLVDLAIELDLPLNVHSRSAGRQTIELLLGRGAGRVQMHAFDGRAAKAMSGVEAGYFFSVPPSIVRSIQKQKLVRRLPLSCLLLETDSPVLSADPNTRNEPGNVTVSLGAIAEIKHVSQEAVIEATGENSVRLYGQRLFNRSVPGLP
jgi:TatD DNase family protein